MANSWVAIGKYACVRFSLLVPKSISEGLLVWDHAAPTGEAVRFR